MIFNIQRFSTHDGPGVRTVVFLKGCPLRCPWCENPESQLLEPELYFDESLCIGCLQCVGVAEEDEISVVEMSVPHAGEAGTCVVSRPKFHRERMRSLDRFRDICPTGALKVVGDEKTVGEIVSEVEKDSPFYGTEGGVTVSGGEPYAQPRFLARLLSAFEEHEISSYVETSLHTAWTAIEPTLPLVDGFLADVKHVDAERFQAATGGNLELVINNLRRLESAQAQVIVRVPVIPGFNGDDATMAQIIEFASSLSNVKEIHLLPYHTLGNGKYRLYDRTMRMANVSSMSAESLLPFAETARNAGLLTRIGG